MRRYPVPLAAALLGLVLLGSAPGWAQGPTPVAARFGDLAACLAAPDRACLIGAAIATVEGTADPLEQAYAFHALASLEREAGRPAEARVLLDRAIEPFGRSPDRHRMDLARGLVLEYASLGDLDAATAFAELAFEPNFLDFVLRDVRLHALGAMALVQLHRFIDGTDDPAMRVLAQVSLADRHMKAGEIERAEAILDRVDRSSPVAEQLLDISRLRIVAQLAHDGQFGRALDAVARVSSRDAQEALMHIVARQSAAGDAAGAAAVLVRVSEPELRDEGHLRVGRAHAKAGDFAAASWTLRRIADRDKRFAALAELAGSIAATGRPADAETEIADLPEIDRGYALGQIAAALAERGDLGQAIGVATRTREAGRAIALTAIGKRQLATDPQEARATLRRAAEYQGAYAEVRRDVALAQVEAGDDAGALATARGIGGPELRAATLKEIAEAQLEAGRIAEGRESLAQAVEASGQGFDDDGEFAALVAGAQMRAGDVAGAIRTLEELDPYYQALALDWMAGAMAKR